MRLTQKAKAKMFKQHCFTPFIGVLQRIPGYAHNIAHLAIAGVNEGRDRGVCGARRPCVCADTMRKNAARSSPASS